MGPRDCRDHRDNLVLRDRQVHQDKMVSQGQMEARDSQDQTGHQGLRDNLVNLV